MARTGEKAVAKGSRRGGCPSPGGSAPNAQPPFAHRRDDRGGLHWSDRLFRHPSRTGGTGQCSDFPQSWSGSPRSQWARCPNTTPTPPTSGPHAPSPAPCGIYRQPVPDIALVHDLEHGVVVIQYDPTISDEERDQLEGFGRDAGTHVIVAPREGMASTIAVTAWTKLMTLDEFDLPAIEGFYGEFAQFGPEAGVQCPFQVDEGSKREPRVGNRVQHGYQPWVRLTS